MVLSWFVYVHTMMVPGYVDRAGRFKGSDYIYFYVMGSLISEGRADALYEPDAHLAEGRRRIDPQLNLYAPYSNYGPQVAAAFAPLSRLTFGRSLAVFLILTALAYAASVWLVWRLTSGARAIWRPARHPCRRLAGVLHADSLCAVERSESSSSIARPGRARSRPPLPGGRRHRADGVQAAARSGDWAGDDPGGRVARRGGRGPRRVSGARGCLAGERLDRDAAVCQRAGDARARSVARADLSRGSSFAAWLCPPADWLACRSLGRLDRRARSGGLDRRADLEERRAPDDEVGSAGGADRTRLAAPADLRPDSADDPAAGLRRLGGQRARSIPCSRGLAGCCCFFIWRRSAATSRGWSRCSCRWS